MHGVALEGASDHGVSEAIYLRDPDGNGIELYRDRPGKRMAARSGRFSIQMHTRPLICRRCSRLKVFRSASRCGGSGSAIVNVVPVASADSTVNRPPNVSSVTPRALATLAPAPRPRTTSSRSLPFCSSRTRHGRRRLTGRFPPRCGPGSSSTSNSAFGSLAQIARLECRGKLEVDGPIPQDPALER